MLQKRCFLLVWLAILFAVIAPAAGADSPGPVKGGLPLPPGPAGLEAVVHAQERWKTLHTGLARPANAGWFWEDTLDDSIGASSIRDAAISGGDVVLAQVVQRARLTGQVLAMAKCNGILYLGTAGARLLRYNPASGTLDDLGTPVPDECYT